MPSKPPSSSSSLPANQKTFSVTETGDTTKENWAGSFTCRCVLNFAQKAEADLLEARLNQGLKDVRQATLTLHYVLSQLHVRLLKAPNWWIRSAGEEGGVCGRFLMDWNVIAKIFEECMTSEVEWRKLVWGEDAEAPKIESSDEEKPNVA